MNYPPLRMAVLTGLIDIKANLAGLDAEDCPYDGETVAVLKELLAPRVTERIVEKEGPAERAERGRPTKDIRLSAEDQQKVRDDIQKTLKSLEDMITENMPTNERIQVAKTKTALLDQLLKMMERHSTVQKVEKFKEAIIAMMDDLLDEQGREILMKRIEPLR